MRVSVFESDGSYLGVVHDTAYYIRLAQENAEKDREIIQKKLTILAKDL